MTVEERFWSKVARRGADDCWVWLAFRFSTKTGRKTYGEFWMDGRNIGAHVAAWLLTFGEKPEGMFVCHSCNNMACCNPQHLYLASNRTNLQHAKRDGLLSCGDNHYSRTNPEKLARGDRHWSRANPELIPRGDRSGARLHPDKMARGSRIARAKLNELSACGVMARWLMGASVSQISREFGVERSTVRKLRDGDTWVEVFREGEMMGRRPRG